MNASFSGNISSLITRHYPNLGSPRPKTRREIYYITIESVFPLKSDYNVAGYER